MLTDDLKNWRVFPGGPLDRGDELKKMAFNRGFALMFLISLGKMKTLNVSVGDGYWNFIYFSVVLGSTLVFLIFGELPGRLA